MLGPARFALTSSGGGEVNHDSPHYFDETTVGNQGVGAQANNNTIMFAYQTENGSSLFYHSGGTITNTSELQMAFEEHAGTVITYALSGGSMTSSGDTNIGSNNGPNFGTFTLAVSGTGTYTGSATARIGDGGGAGAISVLDVSGSGTLTLNDYIQFGDGNSFFKVTGGSASIYLKKPWTGNNNGTGVFAVGGLDFTLDANGTNISPIVCGDNFDLSNVNNAEVVDMALSGGYEPDQDQVFDIITSTGTIFVPGGDASNLLNAGDVGTWSLAIVGGSDKLQATYLLPEPATMALLGLGGLGLLLRRRR